MNLMIRFMKEKKKLKKCLKKKRNKLSRSFGSDTKPQSLSCHLGLLWSFLFLNEKQRLWGAADLHLPVTGPRSNRQSHNTV